MHFWMPPFCTVLDPSSVAPALPIAAVLFVASVGSRRLRPRPAAVAALLGLLAAAIEALLVASEHHRFVPRAYSYGAVLAVAGGFAAALAMHRWPRLALGSAAVTLGALVVTLVTVGVLYGRGGPPGALERIAAQDHEVFSELPGRWFLEPSSPEWVACSLRGEPVEVRHVEHGLLFTRHRAFVGATEMPPHCFVQLDTRGDMHPTLSDVGHPLPCSGLLAGASLVAAIVLLLELVLASCALWRLRQLRLGIEAESDGEGIFVRGSRVAPAPRGKSVRGPLVVQLSPSTGAYRVAPSATVRILSLGTMRDAQARTEQALLLALFSGIGAALAWLLPLLVLVLTPHVVTL